MRLYKQGIKIMQAATMTVLSYPTVRTAIDLFDAGPPTDQHCVDVVQRAMAECLVKPKKTPSSA